MLQPEISSSQDAGTAPGKREQWLHMYEQMLNRLYGFLEVPP